MRSCPQGLAAWGGGAVPGLLLIGLILGSTLSVSVRADIFHLASGGKLEGELLEQDDQYYKIRTVLGTVTLAADAIVRVESAPTPFQEYDLRREQADDTAADQIALAQWCQENGLAREWRQHLQRAIELDPDNAKARQALGQVRVGDMWVDGRRVIGARIEESSPAANPEAATQPTEDSTRLVAAIQGTWRRRITSIRKALLESSLPRQVEKGRERIQEIQDPLAIVPLAEVLSAGNTTSRQVLVQALSRFPDDVATINLVVVALADRSQSVRQQAVAELVRRNDPRVTAQLRKAIEGGDDVLIRRAAVALGALKARESIPELINALKARRDKLVEVPVGRYFDTFGHIFQRRTVLIGTMPVAVNPVIGVSNPAQLIEMERRMMSVTVFRTEVRDALRKICNVDFGFDELDWARWYEEHGQ
ncbi:MAG: HEAT repeat domain-containing protein [Planctomycetota bacterium]